VEKIENDISKQPYKGANLVLRKSCKFVIAGIASFEGHIFGSRELFVCVNTTPPRMLFKK